MKRIYTYIVGIPSPNVKCNDFLPYSLSYSLTAGSIYTHQNALHLLSSVSMAFAPINQALNHLSLQSTTVNQGESNNHIGQGGGRPEKTATLQCLPLPHEFPRNAKDDSLRHEPLIKGARQSDCPAEHEEPRHIASHRFLFCFHNF